MKSSADLERLGIKTYFCSNVCAAYCREIYCELGGFESGTIFNEDMIYAAKLIKSGYSIAYCAKPGSYIPIIIRIFSNFSEILIWQCLRRITRRFLKG